MKRHFILLNTALHVPPFRLAFSQDRFWYKGYSEGLSREQRGGSDRFIPRNPLETPSMPPRCPLRTMDEHRSIPVQSVAETGAVPGTIAEKQQD
jgi:hypothetical protein